MKNRIFLTFYWIFDICVSLAPIALCYCFRHSVQIFVILLNYIFCTSIYLAINSIVGMISDKKHKSELKELSVSKNWLIPMYLENIFLIFALVATIMFTVDSFVRFSNDIISCLLFLLSSIIILILILGQIAWERAVIRSSVAKPIKYYACLANPLRIALFEFIFIASMTP